MKDNTTNLEGFEQYRAYDESIKSVISLYFVICRIYPAEIIYVLSGQILPIQRLTFNIQIVVLVVNLAFGYQT